MIQIEKLIGSEIAKANGQSVSKLGLRFDKIVVQLLGNIRAAIEQEVPGKIVVVMTITAPIKLPTKSEHELIGKIKNFLEFGIQQQDSTLTIFQNEVQLRFVETLPKQNTRFVGLVHNPDIDAKMLLDLTTQWLLKV